MTPDALTSQSRTGDDTTTARKTWLSETGLLVRHRAENLFNSRQQSWAIGMLAHLRRNLGHEPGIDPTIWPMTIEEVSGTPQTDEPSVEERAVHTALTLYASHQQSRDQPMQVTGVGLGQAVARLEKSRGGDQDANMSAVRRRFNAAVTANDLNELTQHLRGLIAQLRAESIGLDYGMLTDDFIVFQKPGGADRVRRRWARQYYYLDREPSAADQGNPSSQPEEQK